MQINWPKKYEGIDAETEEGQIWNECCDEHRKALDEANLRVMDVKWPKKNEEVEFDENHASWGNADDSYEHGYARGHADGYNNAINACRKAVEEAGVVNIPEQELREYLWLNHGHLGLYGDDGEMQCGECSKYGIIDYKRNPLDKVIKAAINARIDVNLNPKKAGVGKVLSVEELSSLLFNEFTKSAMSGGEIDHKKLAVVIHDAMVGKGLV